MEPAAVELSRAPIIRNPRSGRGCAWHLGGVTPVSAARERVALGVPRQRRPTPDQLGAAPAPRRGEWAVTRCGLWERAAGRCSAWSTRGARRGCGATIRGLGDVAGAGRAQAPRERGERVKVAAAPPPGGDRRPGRQCYRVPRALRRRSRRRVSGRAVPRRLVRQRRRQARALRRRSRQRVSGRAGALAAGLAAAPAGARTSAPKSAAGQRAGVRGSAINGPVEAAPRGGDGPGLARCDRRAATRPCAATSRSATPW